MRRTRYVAAGVALLLMGLGIYYVPGCMAIDTCLDKGGRWNYQTKECEYK